MSGSAKPRLLLLSADAKRADDLAELVRRTGHVELAGKVGAAELAAALGRGGADAVLADLCESAPALLAAFEALPEPRPALVACGPARDGALVLRALRLGARDFLPAEHSSAELLTALGKLARGAAGAGAGKRGAILSVMGGKGGVGATLVASQLASALAAMGRRVAIVDLAFPFGDVDLHFDLRSRYTLADLAGRAELDATCLQTVCAEHPSGVRVIAAPHEAEQAERVTAPLVARLLGLLAQDHDFVVLDVARSWSEPVLQALELSDQILLVTLLDVPTLHHVRRQRAVLERLNLAGERIKLIANRSSDADALGDAEVESFLGVVPDAHLPNDFPTATSSVNQGLPVAEIAPGGHLARAFEQLARQLHAWCGLDAPEVREKNGLLGRFGALISRRQHGSR
jgi:pilus assembly protein CpaE